MHDHRTDRVSEHHLSSRCDTTEFLPGDVNDAAPTGYQGQVGAEVPDLMTAHPMPNNVASDVPATKNLLFVKLPDRVLLIDPDSNAIAEILLASDKTGGTSGQEK
jgi:hypothetical protein